MQIDAKLIHIEELFRGAFYEIPPFQREYVWQDAQVEALLSDALDALLDDGLKASKEEYFIGSVVAYRDTQGVFQLIDGQQRITTLFLILCALRDRRIALNDTTSMGYLNQLIQDEFQNEDGVSSMQLRLRPLYLDAGTALSDIVEGKKTVDDATKTITRSMERIVNAYRTATAFLEDQFGENLKSLLLFQAGLTSRVRLVRIETKDIKDALKVFETINDRGVGLNALDLLKNLLFMQLKEKDFEELSKVWKEMIETVQSVGKTEKPLRFLRYVLLSRYANAQAGDKKKPLTEDGLYDWLSKNKHLIGITDEPLQFAKGLLEDARCYRRYVLEPDQNLENLYALTARARQHLIVMLACSKLNKPLLGVVTAQLEKLFVAYTLAQEQTKNLDVVFANAAPVTRAWIDENIHRDDFSSALMTQCRSWVDPEIDRLRGRIQDGFDRLGEDRRIVPKFILCRIAQYLEQIAGMPSRSLKELSEYEIEHVLPQNPTIEQKEAFDVPDAYIHWKGMLGNLTLLDKPINASLGRDFFAEKKPAYALSGLFLTRSLAKSQELGQTKLTTAANKLTQFVAWNSQSIEKRQSDLRKIVLEMWGFQ